ncbi:MAG: efflux RND transporter periplasmic adaptor subunit [Sulfurimonas sp.]|uniref:efflux RND transporter periplasmic adaptor subunit n=1 Tax=Sulfurimonas sp. TaxID=2022749 RepID=UPI0025D0C858|nr:efflux RND transporter periplasmic adaptor subunit [Sulfurimonas sp.]MCK9491450.1 efflux RND transporter periplasmic adaptor subunit [Sulfurimonas sp.]
MKHLLLCVIIFLNIQGADEKPRASLVVTQVVKEGYASALQSYVGSLYYDINSNLASQSSGAVSRVFVKESQAVKKGEVLVKLDSSILEANIKAKKAMLNSYLANFTKQQKDLQRADALLEKNSIAQSSHDATFYTLEALKAEIEAQEAELLSMNIQLDKMSIKAPFDAIVVKRNVDVGEWVTEGSSVLNIVDPKSIEAVVNVPSQLLGILKEGQKLQAKIDERDLEVSIKSIVPLADTASRTLPLKLSFSSENSLIEGMRIDVEVPTLKKQKVLLVPRDAVIKRFGSYVVFSVVDAKAVMINIKVVNYTQNEAAILSDELSPGQRVVTKGNERIFPNMDVVEKGN